MNNKLFARIMTAVICICMMSTVVFAADPVLTIDGDTATMSFLVGTEGADISKNTAEDQITMMAYLVDEAAEAVPAYTDQKIVAINQVAGAAGFGNVLIDASKLETGKKIAVVLGGSDGTTESFFAVEETSAPTTYTATFVCEVEPVEAMTGNAEGATIELPAVPEKSGFTGVWNDGTTDYEGGATYTFGAADVTFTAVYAEVSVEPTYTSTTQDVTYNNIEGTVVRIAGLDTTKVVTVDGVTAQYYKKTDSTIVHVACVPKTAAPVISVADGTPTLMLYGDSNGKDNITSADVTDFARKASSTEVKTPTGVTLYTLPSDLMELHKLDVNADGDITSSDVTMFARSASSTEVKTPTGVTLYTLDTMNCYKN